ncbi:MAG TPA: ABC transporter substrate-binding protein [Burkholderiales bacterium]|jgi:putative ABC transport system substrate-binding protein|nr:ABC transporter substrate-binding protein [Burkholderiales bacterium]
MNHRRHLILAAAAAAIAPRSLLGQQSDKVYHVGLVSIGTDPANPSRWKLFTEAMRALNYIEGRNLVIHPAFCDGRPERLPGLIAELMKAKVDVMVVTGAREIAATRKATSSIPIVMTLANDPVAEGFVKSLARPGGNVTGLTGLIPGLSQKLVELLHEVLPSAKTFAVVTMPPNPTPGIRRELATAGDALGLKILFAQATTPHEFDSVHERVKREGAAGIIHPIDGGTSVHRPAFVKAALRSGLPGIYWDYTYVEQGGLMTYSVNWPDQLRRAAVYVDKILRGANPADLPVEQPVRVELVINLKTAKAFNLTIPRALLVRADQVIE